MRKSSILACIVVSLGIVGCADAYAKHGHPDHGDSGHHYGHEARRSDRPANWDKKMADYYAEQPSGYVDDRSEADRTDKRNHNRTGSAFERATFGKAAHDQMIAKANQELRDAASLDAVAQRGLYNLPPATILKYRGEEGVVTLTKSSEEHNWNFRFAGTTSSCRQVNKFTIDCFERGRIEFADDYTGLNYNGNNYQFWDGR